VVAAHELLARAPAALLSATLEDAVAEPGRPNIPGTDGQHLNWCTALAVPIDEIETHPLALRVAAVLRAATDDRPRENSPRENRPRENRPREKQEGTAGDDRTQ
jgi:4-alpha-glucanotransferase